MAGFMPAIHVLIRRHH